MGELPPDDLRPDDQPSPGLPHGSPPDLPPEELPRVLVMEDDPSVRSLLHTLLDAEGYDVVTASDGLSGLVQATARPPSLVLLDIMMPDLGGMRVLQELRADPVLFDVPVIVVTGRVEAVPQLEADLGDEFVFVKPFGVSELLARVAVLTGKGSPS
ncbi:MAG TPA: response regulator transcription factor [Frankiaceae bacterium]|nr:response regulator transcription factor [Frankiaceae bacterium]